MNDKSPTKGAFIQRGIGFASGDVLIAYDSPVFTAEQFRTHMQTVWGNLDNILTSKDAEYGGEEDTFSTVKHIAEAWGEKPRNVALKLALKHYMSLLHEGHHLNDTQIRERVNDIHVYLEIAYCNWEEK